MYLTFLGLLKAVEIVHQRKKIVLQEFHEALAKMKREQTTSFRKLDDKSDKREEE